MSLQTGTGDDLWAMHDQRYLIVCILHGATGLVFGDELRRVSMVVDVTKLPDEKLARGSADAVLRLLQVLCMAPLRAEERPNLTKAAVQWFLNLAAHMGVKDAHVQAEFKNDEDGCRCEYTPLNDSARLVKDYLLQCELQQELTRG